VSWSSSPDVNEKRIAEAISLAKDGFMERLARSLSLQA
jgi:hypothetical protein